MYIIETVIDFLPICIKFDTLVSRQPVPKYTSWQTLLKLHVCIPDIVWSEFYRNNKEAFYAESLSTKAITRTHRHRIQYFCR